MQAKVALQWFTPPAAAAIPSNSAKICDDKINRAAARYPSQNGLTHNLSTVFLKCSYGIAAV